MTHHRARIALILLPVIVGSALLSIIPLFLSTQPRVDSFQSNPPNTLSPQTSQITDNTMYGAIQLSTDQVYRGQNLTYNVTVGQVGMPIEMLNWSFGIQNLTEGGDEFDFADWSNITEIEYPIMNDTWPVPLSASAGSYRVFLSIFNGTDNTNVFKDFSVINNRPIITSVIANESSVYRNSAFNVTVNATDIEIGNLAPDDGNDANIYVRVYYRNPNGEVYSVNAKNQNGTFPGNYSARISTEKSWPVGIYSYWVAVQDYRAGMEEKENITSDVYTIPILNQNPSINVATGMIINDQPANATDIRIRMGKTINITIFATDPENSVHYIQIKLQHDNGTSRNYTMNYADSSHTIIIDTEDLLVGTWYIYLTVIDADGGTYEPPIPPSIEILPDTWTMAAPIVFLIIGIIIGIAVGAALIGWRARKNINQQMAKMPVTEIEPKSSSEKIRKKSEDEESPNEEESEGEEKTSMKRKIRRRIN
ncbi:MAG: hypothetical protein RBG13Loki_2739 [Promethearchaeota archaeon CR_4]|nr:MAG: hypothetical protein RBG13Loki_2739 [Candidatus Lokiarchaeota archaeon CR_4]